MEPANSATQLHIAAHDGKYVIAYKCGLPVGDGFIEELTGIFVKLNGEWYGRDSYNFFVIDDAEERILFKHTRYTDKIT
ncbi:hypothetical protein BCM02_10911 [Paenibacillus methanolicus]|uniref:Uncharacterized protein n=1 Tax=Paenibacillus methanolicus TaxID=582686 RepID=A0A5S5C197_9BACL|nr:hypothetical protein BCM02_10911 [Paenibacillus methanolicus]